MEGCGLREATGRRHAQYIGAMVQSLLPLLDRCDSSGARLKGRLHINPVVNLLGEKSFDHPSQQPWAHLISTSRSGANIDSGLQHAWSHLTSNFQDVEKAATNIDTSNYILRREVGAAGFYGDGSIAGLVTNALSTELERCRGKHLSMEVRSSLDKDDYERWSFEGWNKMSTVLLLSPLDQFRYFEDTTFQVTFTMYLGLLCPIIAPVAGRFFGKKGVRLDQYGENLAAAALPGQGYRRTHNKL